MLHAVEDMAELIKIFDQGDVFLTDPEWVKAMKLGDSFLKKYDFLSAWALEKGQTVFHMVIKHRTFQHLIENSKFLNPKTHWTFSSEDFVGKISILAASVSPGVSSTKLNTKLTTKYRMLPHFLLTREGMDMSGRKLEP